MLEATFCYISGVKWENQDLSCKYLDAEFKFGDPSFMIIAESVLFSEPEIKDI